MRKEGDGHQKIAIVHFPRALPGKIYQRDLEEFLDLTAKLRKAETLWDQKREYITQAIGKGVTVEGGLREAFLARLVVR